MLLFLCIYFPFCDCLLILTVIENKGKELSKDSVFNSAFLIELNLAEYSENVLHLRN